jgi:hypothetical protein
MGLPSRWVREEGCSWREDLCRTLCRNLARARLATAVFACPALAGMNLRFAT